MDRALVQRLRMMNPWLTGSKVERAPVAARPARWIPRTQVDIDGFSGKGKAHLLVGPRQAGKSTLAWEFVRAHTRPLLVNCEEPLVRPWCRSAAGFLADLPSLVTGGPDVLFVEEVQWLDEAGLFIKGLVDHRPDFPIVVTGSASFHLRSRHRESLAGRATRHVLLPFSLAEVAPAIDQAPAMLWLERLEALDRMLRVGGYPEAWLSEAPEVILGELLSAFVIRDASDLFAVERPDAYRRLLQLCAEQVGNLVNVAGCAEVCGVNAGTVVRYLDLMEESHVVRLLPAFSGGRRREIKTARKLYFCDNGLRNAVLGRAASPVDVEKGALTENWVFTELAKALPWEQGIHYWRSRSAAEVDFVVPRHDRVLGIEVKAGGMRRPKLSRSCRSFIEAYEPGELWVLSKELEHEGLLGSTRVRWLRLTDLPEHVKAWLAVGA